MSPSSDQRVAEFYAQTYDKSVPDWPGEIDFYRELASNVKRDGEALLELACGTGRVAIRFEMEHLLARVGFSVQAVYGDFFRHPLEDKSSEMIWVAQKTNVEENE